MNSKNRTVALIPARGGSKSIPYKNIKQFNGKPLIAWTIEAALKTPEIDRVIVSTDDKKISEVSKKYGAEVFHRDKELASDFALPIDVIRSVISRLKTEGAAFETMVYLEPTSPLRIPKDIQETLQLINHSEQPTRYRSAATYTTAELNPHRAWKIAGGTPQAFIGGANPWLPRQLLPEAYQLNGAVYAFCIGDIDEKAVHLLPEPSGAVLMPEERSIDIDNEIDFMLAELLHRREYNVEP
ncbi:MULTISPECIES: cytidylyltransferase domain-containing protein [Alteribacter]|uniref:Acylneuraminate cytidylyltransferase family protein n=1 Tax=Alteribacter keqinensis TaxID=2483800 RepID=A0A3M7TND6_9BACI|nr:MULTISPECIES: acylneuraminate cytidylyltransferase family protein [Alteribacter]MBM7094950.1 acylneuraminate cytidylyltransferase family protein [Alteribacter salitolerans]RNA66754.1 acylneuraminate cytidylyltransferase family protein [Alteribacter keqinensis]